MVSRLRPHTVSTQGAARPVAAAEERVFHAAEAWFSSGLASVLTEAAPGAPQLVAAAELVRDDPHAFGCWLKGATRDEQKLKAMVERSYWHSNGFAKLVLHTSAEPEFKIRMHVWPRSEASRRGEPNPHSHRWEFASTVLTGRGVVVPEYREASEGGDPFGRYRYGTDPDAPEALVADGAVRLVKTRSPRVSRGDVYSCGTEVIHTLEPLGTDLTATIVVQGPRRESTTVVFRARGRSEEEPSRRISEVEFRQIVAAVVTEICGGSSPR
ncbi:hypothetical protein ACIRSS_39445 [Amycolatopsis sp. NPDC101161]|uniref:hypothetical protein n=1 Tax=Amycolatopsis sp. NPDC101161 TaxID=3363940 RepID=UPI00380D438D